MNMSLYSQEREEDTRAWVLLQTPDLVDYFESTSGIQIRTEFFSQGDVDDDFFSESEHAPTPLSDTLLNSGYMTHQSPEIGFNQDVAQDYGNLQLLDMDGFMDAAVDPALFLSPAPSAGVTNASTDAMNQPHDLFDHVEPVHAGLPASRKRSRADSTSSIAAAMIGNGDLGARANMSNAAHMREHMRTLVELQQHQQQQPARVMQPNGPAQPHFPAFTPDPPVMHQPTPNPSHFQRVPTYAPNGFGSNFNLQNTYVADAASPPIGVARRRSQQLSPSIAGKHVPQTFNRAKRSASVMLPPTAPMPIVHERLVNDDHANDRQMHSFLTSRLTFFHPAVHRNFDDEATPLYGDFFTKYECSIVLIMHDKLKLDIDTIIEVIRFHRSSLCPHPLRTPQVQLLLHVLRTPPVPVWVALSHHVVQDVRKSRDMWEMVARKAYDEWMAGMRNIVLKSYDADVIDLGGRVKANMMAVSVRDFGVNGGLPGFGEGVEGVKQEEQGEAQGDGEIVGGLPDVWRWAGCANPIAEARGLDVDVAQ